jgi:formylmethanofuran dehydrogenase subunit E-like metal-binding protein
MENLKQLLKSGKVVVFDNETTFTDDFRSAECSFRDEQINAWANGFKIEFNGAVVVSSTRFDVFERKLEQLKKDWNLQLKSW